MMVQQFYWHTNQILLIPAPPPSDLTCSFPATRMAGRLCFLLSALPSCRTWDENIPAGSTRSGRCSSIQTAVLGWQDCQFESIARLRSLSLFWKAWHHRLLDVVDGQTELWHNP